LPDEQVMDKNDNSPEFSFPSSHNSTVRLSSYAPQGHLVTHVTANDLDAGDNGHVTYRVVNKDKTELEHFRLDSESGAVVVAEPLDGVDHKVFQLNILAVDHGVPARFSPRDSTCEFLTERSHTKLSEKQKLSIVSK